MQFNNTKLQWIPCNQIFVGVNIGLDILYNNIQKNDFVIFTWLDSYFFML